MHAEPLGGTTGQPAGQPSIRQARGGQNDSTMCGGYTGDGRVKLPCDVNIANWSCAYTASSSVDRQCGVDPPKRSAAADKPMRMWRGLGWREGGCRWRWKFT